VQNSVKEFNECPNIDPKQREYNIKRVREVYEREIKEIEKEKEKERKRELNRLKEFYHKKARN
jgi:hypothetical protein